MTQAECEQKKRECWEECAAQVAVETENLLCKAISYTTFDRAYALGKQEKDAEGEEMLTVKRSDVIKEFDKLHRYSYQASDLQLGLNALRNLFGSKCLPDELNKDNFAKSEPKPAGPKFKVGDKVRVIGAYTPSTKALVGSIGEILDINNMGDCFVLFPKTQAWIYYTCLQPYTEPTCTQTCTDDCPSQDHIADANKMVDTILKDSFRKHNRLHIATQITAAIYANADTAKGFKSIEAIVRKALDIADTLIKEAEKGVQDGK